MLPTIRRLQPSDAPALVECVRAIYGETYPCPVLYDPGAILHHNESGEWQSAIALDETGRVIGHIALERYGIGPVWEIGMAMVLPEYRSRGVRKQLLHVLSDAAATQAIPGIFSEMGTAREPLGELPGFTHSHPCGLTLGLWPGTVRTNPSSTAPAPRVSFLMFFRYRLPLTKPSPLHLPEEYQSIASRIFAQWILSVEFATPQALPPQGELRLEPRAEWNSLYIRVPRVGRDALSQLDQVCDRFRQSNKFEAAYLELPLAQPGADAICRHARTLGFFFSGIGPHFFNDGHALRMQCLKSDPQLNLLSFTHPFGPALRDFLIQDVRATPPRG
jgi:GNAT superfamily N-acetyltransferase